MRLQCATIETHAGSRRRVFLAMYCATALGCRYWFKNLQLGHSFQRSFRGVRQMSIFPHLAALGLAAALSSPIHPHQIDFKATSPDGIQRINQLWLVTYINEAGQETVAQPKLVTGED